MPHERKKIELQSDVNAHTLGIQVSIKFVSNLIIENRRVKVTKQFEQPDYQPKMQRLSWISFVIGLGCVQLFFLIFVGLG